MNPAISVIIPVYNCEAYLPACIASLRAQTLQALEFIFVCDGSPDRSLSILRDAEKTDSRVRVIAFPENRGVSAARNAGLDVAQGEFIGFCDGDDFIEPQMYEALLTAAREKDADAAFCRVYKDRASGTEDVPLGFEDGTRFTRETIRETLIPAMLSRETDSDALPLSGYTPRNIFRRAPVSDVRFREDIHYAEDLLFIIECMLRVQAAVAVDRAYYHYRFHAGSVTKRYSPHVPRSYDLSNDAIEQLLSGNAEAMRRMEIRRRKMAITAVRNYSMPGTPYSFPQQVRLTRAYMNREDVRRCFADVRPFAFGRQLGLKLFLLKHRLAFASCVLFGLIFR